MPLHVLAPLAVAVAFLAGCVAAIAWVRIGRLPRRLGPGAAADAVTLPPPQVSAPPSAPRRGLPTRRRRRADRVLAPPPAVDGITPLWVWLQRNGLWPQVAQAFDDAITSDLDVGSYCWRMDPDDVRRHHGRMLLTLCMEGLTYGRLQALVQAHREVRSAEGRAITGEVVDVVVSALGTALTDAGVPDATLDQVVAVSVPIREALTDGAVVGRLRRWTQRAR